ncbi:unnamed protein product [Rotaria magnacalcarata]|uniref:NAD(P)(+)--arginine ADP-ribosyltransferase n=1 Tax=Rotaria magnacalcarata TaxID=392030 RepID=A0A815C135_9BILA|nr:unnamed protein product [Rotaria magnacalcarata]CAF1643375.1 unnamed protein product [Rotaria magnacalcarata]CAF1959694.1 unnamed protein product [Rotaria magnacalcarata]CAF2228481.1 unnamed protein product [Rotaria magnacalcarata]CAF3720074.1 unnamed protein product [Rotaria magnacalcarata]
MDASEFFYACSNGDLALVQWLLPTLPLAEIDRLEPNGNTALHAACANGHTEIVRLLLRKGAASHLKDVFNSTPTDVATNPEIKQLFQRPLKEAQSRFKSYDVHTEWTLRKWSDAVVHYFTLYPVGEVPTIADTALKIINTDDLDDGSGMKKITEWMKQARENNDSTYFLRAYTSSTIFYEKLNLKLAQHANNQLNPANLPWYLALPKHLYHQDTLSQYRYLGNTYRGMIMTKTDFDQYQVGEIILNKAFLSTSTSRDVAEFFALSGADSSQKVTISSYKIENENVALDLSTFSEFPSEQEVLILPGFYFKVTAITAKDRYIEIELEQQSISNCTGRRLWDLTGNTGTISVSFINEQQNIDGNAVEAKKEGTITYEFQSSLVLRQHTKSKNDRNSTYDPTS